MGKEGVPDYRHQKNSLWKREIVGMPVVYLAPIAFKRE
jgi:hypothetical protein